jgi:hypothetical protein
MGPSDSAWLAKGGVEMGRLGPETTVAALRNYLVAFFDANLRGQPMNSLLTKRSADFFEVVVTTQEQSPCGNP